MKERTRGRGWAVQALYAWEVRGGTADTLVPIFQNLAEEKEISQRNRFYADVLIRIVARNLDEIDRTIEEHLDNWTFDRLSMMDRNILRLGVAELLHVDDVEAEVSRKEMMKIASRFGTDESPRFIGGVLDAVATHRAAGRSSG